METGRSNWLHYNCNRGTACGRNAHRGNVSRELRDDVESEVGSGNLFAAGEVKGWAWKEEYNEERSRTAAWGYLTGPGGMLLREVAIAAGRHAPFRAANSGNEK